MLFVSRNFINTYYILLFEENKMARCYCHWQPVAALQWVLGSNYELQVVGSVHLKLEIATRAEGLLGRSGSSPKVSVTVK